MKTSVSVFVLPLLSAALLLPGCSSNATTDATAPQPAALTSSQSTSPSSSGTTLTSGVDPVTGATPDAKPVMASAKPQPAAKPSAAKPLVSKATTTAKADAPDPAYTVVDEGAQLPPEAAAALKKLVVSPPPKNFPVPAKSRVTLQTSKGNIVLELDGKAAPLQVKSFLYLSQKGFFNGTLFHRYVPGFVIQGGDPLTRSPETRQFAGAGGPGYQIPREKNSLTHEKPFVLAAARTADPNSAGSQFYITLAPTPGLDAGRPESVDPYGYTVFGRVVSGSDVVLKLAQDDALKKVVVAGDAKQSKK